MEERIANVNNTYAFDSLQICLGPLWDTRTQVSQDWTGTNVSTCSSRMHSCLWSLRKIINTATISKLKM